MKRQLCKCGCGKEVKNKYVVGHNNRGIKLEDYHQINCKCCICKAKRGEFKGENNPMYGKKRPDLSELNKSRIGQSSWNKNITGEEYLSHFKNIKLWKENKRKGEKLVSPEQRTQCGINSILKQSKSKKSAAEKLLEVYLRYKKVNFISQYPYKLGIADFYIPEEKLIIQCYGNYWHSKPDYIKRDKKQNDYLFSEGYNILVLSSESIVKNGPEKELMGYY